MTAKRTRIKPRPYHHGDLKAALLKEAERILEREGIQALTLRAAARAAGVSHTAPQNHFGDLTGLLSELAATGFQKFGADLSKAAEAAGAEPGARLKAMGMAYVAFARAHPGLFALMYRSERLDGERPALREAIDVTRQALRAATAARSPDKSLTPVQGVAQAAAVWSLVHGFAMLLLEGRFEGLMKMPPGGITPDELLSAVLDATRVGG